MVLHPNGRGVDWLVGQLGQMPEETAARRAAERFQSLGQKRNRRPAAIDGSRKLKVRLSNMENRS